MTGKEIVREVICLFNGGKRWTQGRFCKDGYGNSGDIASGETFCLLGAALKVSGKERGNLSDPEIKEFAGLVADSFTPKDKEYVKAQGGRDKLVPSDMVVYFNDREGRTFEEIEAVLAKALVRKPRKAKQATA